MPDKVVYLMSSSYFTGDSRIDLPRYAGSAEAHMRWMEEHYPGIVFLSVLGSPHGDIVGGFNRTLEIAGLNKVEECFVPLVQIFKDLF